MLMRAGHAKLFLVEVDEGKPWNHSHFDDINVIIFQNIMVSLSSEQVQKYYEPMCIHLPLIGLAVEEMAGRGVPAVSVTIQLKIS